MFCLVTLPLINAIKTVGALQCWFADDAASGGCLIRLRAWWDRLTLTGPLFGYYLNTLKTVLVVKPDLHEEAMAIFQDTNIEITCIGHRYLCGALDTPALEIDVLKRRWLNG